MNVFSALVLRICLGLLLCGPLWARPLGMVSNLQGRVPALDLLDPVQEGQKLSLPAGTSCTVIWYADGHRETVRGPARVEITARGFKGAPVLRSPASRALQALAPQSPPGPAYVAGVARFPVQPATAVPGVAQIMGRPRLFETYPMAAEARLCDPEGKVLLSQPIMLEGLWAVPDELALQPGLTYRLVFLESDGRELASRSFRLQAAASDLLAEFLAMAEVDSTDPAPWIGRATLLSRDGCYDQALNAWQEALTRRPSAALLRSAAETCERLGYASQARCYRALARSLGSLRP